MIIVKTAPLGYIAQLYVEDHVEFDVEQEQHAENARLAGEPWAKPCPPHTHYGLGGDRRLKKTYLDESGNWCPSIKEAIETLQSKKHIKAAEVRIKRAEEKLAWEKRRLEGLTSKQRAFDEDTGEEIL
jgi:hypothetical protein